MEITIGKNAGFCAGVEVAINKANEILSQGSVYCLGEIVHNKQVIENLEKNGMRTVDNIEEVPDGESVIFRSHGEPAWVYQRADEKKLKVYDLTCSNVKVIHNKVQKEKENSFIIVVGVKNHPEVIGTIGFAGENSAIIESEDDILDAYMEYEKTALDKVFVVAQTTFSSKKFDELAVEIDKNFCEADVIIDKTICASTENRQLEAIKISKNSDVMLIVGGQNSSNTRKLYEIACQNCEKVYYVQTVEDVSKITFSQDDKVGILAGASTPKYIIEDVKNYLERNY